LEQINREIQQKTEKLVEVADQSGAAAGNGVARQLSLQRLGRVEEELIRLETEKLRADSKNQSDYANRLDERMAKLRQQQAELEKSVLTEPEAPLELRTLRNELNELQRFSSELVRKLQIAEIEFNAPRRIEMIQKAVISPE
jgi:hypothetical protein